MYRSIKLDNKKNINEMDGYTDIRMDGWMTGWMEK